MIHRKRPVDRFVVSFFSAIVKFKIPTFAYDKVMGVDNDVLRRISRETATQIVSHVIRRAFDHSMCANWKSTFQVEIIFSLFFTHSVDFLPFFQHFVHGFNKMQ